MGGESWRYVPLKDAGKWLSGGTPSTANEAFWGGDIPWISGASMKDFRISDSDRKLTELGARSGSSLVDPGVTLFVVRGMSLKSEFRVGITERRVAFGQDCKAIIPADGIAPEFLSRAIQSRTSEILTLVEETSHGTGRLDTARLQELEIPVPSLDEQYRIVAAHAAFERRIGAWERAIAKLRIAREALMESLIDGSAVPLEEILDEKPKNGYSPQETPDWSGIQALGLGCLTEEGFVPRQLKNVPDSTTARRYVLHNGDVIMSRANTRELVGLVCRYRDVGTPCIYPDLMMRLRPDEERCISAYLEIVLGTPSVRKQVRKSARGTSESMVKISWEVLRRLTVPLPCVERQRKIVKSAHSLDSRIDTLKVVVTKLRTIQQGVVGDLLATPTRRAT